MTSQSLCSLSDSFRPCCGASDNKLTDLCDPNDALCCCTGKWTGVDTGEFSAESAESPLPFGNKLLIQLAAICCCPGG